MWQNKVKLVIIHNVDRCRDFSRKVSAEASSRIRVRRRRGADGEALNFSEVLKGVLGVRQRGMKRLREPV